MPAELLNQYTEICRVAIKSSSAKLGKTFENLLMEIILLYVAIQRKINFTQMERYGTHCQPRHKNQLDFSYNALFASQNVAKVMMKENRLPIFMTSFKEIMASTYIAKLFFDRFRIIPSRKLISHTIKNSSADGGKLRSPYLKFNYCCNETIKICSITRKYSSHRNEFLRFNLYFCYVISEFCLFIFTTLR